MIKFFTLLLILVVNARSQTCIPFDHSFGTAGKSIGNTASGNGMAPNARNILIQSDTAIVQIIQDISPTIRSGFGAIRYTNSGRIDSSFGSNGKAVSTFGTNDSYPYMGALQSDGKIVICGMTYNGANWDFGLVRYNKDGTPDNSFGTGGKVVTAVGGNDDIASGLSIQLDGKIIVVGGSGDAMNIQAWAIVRYMANGAIDSSFGTNGKLVTHLGSFVSYIGNIYYGTYAYEAAKSVVVQPDGKIVIAGDSYQLAGCYDYYGSLYCNPSFAMMRLNVNGKIDSTFGTNGKVADSVKLVYGAKIALQDDGKIVATGTSYQSGFIVERYTANGSLDAGFGTGGVVENLFAGLYSYGNSSEVCIQAGKIIIGGTAYNGTVSKMFITRLDQSGKPETAFNLSGTSAIDLVTPPSNDYLSGFAIQGKKILISGTAYQYLPNTVITQIAVVRLLDSTASLSPVIASDGAPNVCQGDTILLRSSQAGAIQWYKNDFKIFNANDTVYRAVTGGTYAVLVSNSNGCGLSAPFLVSEKSLPPTPVITYVNDPGAGYLSTAAGYTRYQWYLNGIIIPGADSNKYIPLQSGTFIVEHTDTNNCSSLSVPYNFVVVSVTDIIIGNSKVHYFPNPANSIINLEIPKEPYDKIFAELYDHSGKLVRKLNVVRGHNEINVSSLPSGVYQLQLYTKKERVTRKVMVIR